MPEDGKPESAEFVKFKAAMRQIVSVRKIDVVDRLPNMFQERTPTKKARKK